MNTKLTILIVQSRYSIRKKVYNIAIETCGFSINFALMSNYIDGLDFVDRTFTNDDLKYIEYESCTFKNCTFERVTFVAMAFIDCHFIKCNLNQANVNHTAFRSALFSNCIITDVNFAMCDRFLFSLNFENCQMDFCKFYDLKMKAVSFKNCKLIAVDFMATDLSNADFEASDLRRATIIESNLTKADFSKAYNYVFNPKLNKVKGAIFSKDGLPGLLEHFDIIVKQ